MNELQIANFENTDITAWDFPQIKKELEDRLSFYANIVYTDESIKNAKNDRTTLNKVKSAIEGARKEYKSRCLAPYDALEPQIKELVNLVDNQLGQIKSTVDDYEERQRDAKEKEVRKYYDRKAVSLGDLAGALYPKMFDKKWTNASTGKNKYEEAVLDAINRASADIEEIKALNSPFEDSLIECYIDTLSVEKTLDKLRELEEATHKANLTVAGTQPSSPTDKSQISDAIEDGFAMRIYASQKQIEQIKDFMKAIGVHYELI